MARTPPRRHIIRGATSIIPADKAPPEGEPTGETPSPGLRVAVQPIRSHRDQDVILARRKRVIEPRLNKLIDYFRLVAEAGNDELYGFSVGEKQNIIEIVEREFGELRKALTHGTRGSRYITIEELGGEEY